MRTFLNQPSAHARTVDICGPFAPYQEITAPNIVARNGKGLTPPARLS